MIRSMSVLAALVIAVSMGGGCSQEPPKNGEIVDAPAPAKTPPPAPPANKPTVKFQ